MGCLTQVLLLSFGSVTLAEHALQLTRTADGPQKELSAQRADLRYGATAVSINHALLLGQSLICSTANRLQLRVQQPANHKVKREKTARKKPRETDNVSGMPVAKHVAADRARV